MRREPGRGVARCADTDEAAPRPMAATVARVETDEKLVRQAFFWSAPGSKLFGNHPDCKDPLKLRALLADAIAQQPSIVITHAPALDH